MPYQLRHRTRVATTESASSSSTASSATLEHNEGNADEPLLKKGSGTKRLERGLSRSNNAKPPNANSDQASSPPNRKRRRVEQADILANTTNLRTSMVRSLDMLFQAQQNHQRTTTTIVGTIENGCRGLVAESRKLLKSQMCRLYNGELAGFADWDNQARTLVGDLAEDLLGQQFCLFENGLKDVEQSTRIVVADLGEGIWAQQCRVLGMKRYIQLHGAGNECN